MKRSKIAFITAIMLMISVVLSGCSPQEISYYETLKRLMNFAYDHKLQETGKMKITINSLGDGLSSDKSMETVIKNINKYGLEYTGTTDYPNNTYEMAFFYNDGVEKTDAFALKRVNNTTYVKIGKKSIELFGALIKDEEQKQILDTIEKSGGWVAVGDEFATKQLESLTDTNALAASKTKINNPFDIKEGRKLVNMYMRLYDNLIYDGYNKLDLGTVKQNGDTYTMSIDGAGFYDLGEKTALYTIDNNKAVAGAVIKWMMSLDSSEMKTLGLDDKTIVEGIQGISKMAESVEAGKAEAKKAITGMDPKQKDMIKKALSGIKVDVTMKDLKAAGYDTSINYKIAIQDPTSGKMLVDMGITAESAVRAADTVKIEAPTSISIEKLAETAPTWLNVYSYGSYTLNEKLDSKRGELPVVNKGGVLYVGAKDTSGLLKENVQWNQAQKNVSISKDGGAVVFDTLLQGNVAYIKVKDFEKLGYSVKWNAEDGYAKISKFAK